jgi:hypothetical protein
MWHAVLIVGALVSGEAPGAEPASIPTPVAALPPGVDTSKVECVKHHEEAQISRRDGRLLEARASLQLCSGAACPGAIRGDCVEWLDQVGRSLPSVVVTAHARGADVTDVQVRVDGKLVAERLTGAALEMDPGEHRFHFESPPWPPVERTILVSEGVKGRALDVDFAPLPPALPPVVEQAAPGPRPLQTVDYVLGGAALAGLGTFAVFGAWSLYEHNRLMDECAPFCSPDEVSPLRWKVTVADVALGVAVASLAVGGYLYATRPNEPRRTVGTTARRPPVSISVGAQGAGLRLMGAF